MNQFPVSSETLRERRPPLPAAVSIVLTYYNYRQFVRECLDSLIAQTQSELELVIVDDTSTDGGLDLILEWIDTSKDRLFAYQVIRHSENLGLPVARNTGFAAANADLVFAMDADNILYPRAIARCREAILNSGADGAYTQLEVFGAQRGIGQADFWSREGFQVKNYVDAMALIKKAAWLKVGGYSQLSAIGWEDYDFWCKFIEHGLRCAFVPEMLCRYRTHENSMSATQTIPKTDALVIDMSIRHPWLNL